MPRHLLALALGVCAGVAVMVVAARGIALSRMLYLLAGLIFAGNLFAALAFDYWSMLAARFIAGLPHGARPGLARCLPDGHGHAPRPFARRSGDQIAHRRQSESRLKTPTLQEYVDTMMPEVKKLKCRRNPRSADNFTTALRTHVLTKLGKVKLKDIDTRKVKDCLSQLWSTLKVVERPHETLLGVGLSN